MKKTTEELENELEELKQKKNERLKREKIIDEIQKLKSEEHWFYQLKQRFGFE